MATMQDQGIDALSWTIRDECPQLTGACTSRYCAPEARSAGPTDGEPGTDEKSPATVFAQKTQPANIPPTSDRLFLSAISGR